MKRRFFVILMAALACIGIAVPAYADFDVYNVIDMAGVLTEDEFRELDEGLCSLSEELRFDIAVIIMDTLDGTDANLAAESIYDTFGYGYGPDCDGAMLLINMGERDVVITSVGYGRTALNARAQDYVLDNITPMLSSGDYYGAIETFGKMTGELTADARSGHVYKTPFGLGRAVIIALAAGLLVGLVAVGTMKAQLKSVRSRSEAGDYIVPGSLDIAVARERYLYRTLLVSPKPEENSSSGRSGSSGSTSHTTTGRKF